MKKVLLLTVLSIGVLSMTSCKKNNYGCTDPLAINYSTEANLEDGSCFYDSDISNSSPNVIIEEFVVTFSTAAPSDSYSPNFTKEDGDIILMEIESDQVGSTSYWTAMPYAIGSDVVIWGEYSDFGTCYIYSQYVNSGNPAQWTGTAAFNCRIALIKESGLTANPDLKNMSIEELEELM